MSPAADEEILALGRQPLSVQQAHAEGMALTEPRPLASGLGSEFRKYLFRRGALPPRSRKIRKKLRQAD